MPNAARSCSETVNGSCAWKDEDGNQHFHPGFLALVKQLMAQPEGIPKLLKHHAENFLLVHISALDRYAVAENRTYKLMNWDKAQVKFDGKWSTGDIIYRGSTPR